MRSQLLAKLPKGYRAIRPAPGLFAQLRAHDLAATQAFLCGGVPFARERSQTVFATFERDHAYAIDYDDEMGAFPASAFATKRGKLAPAFDPSKLYWRTLWLAGSFLHNNGFFDDAEELARAPRIAVYASERNLFTRAPHLAAYWVWHHWVFGNSELDDALARTQKVAHPFVRDSREAIGKLRAGAKLSLGGRDRTALASARESLQEIAPPHVRSARATSSKRADDSELPPEARTLLRELEREYHLLDDRAVNRFVELADARFRPLLLERLAVSARCDDEDNHRRATRGLLLAWARVARDLREFERELAAAGGTKRYGYERLGELATAYAQFTEPAATRWLAREARAFASDQLEGPPHYDPSYIAFCALVERDAVPDALLVAYLKRERVGKYVESWGGDTLDLRVIALAAKHRVEATRPALEAIANRPHIWASVAKAARIAARRLTT